MLKTVWIVAVKVYYYPSVYEFDNEADALNEYEKQLKNAKNNEDSPDFRLYIAKSERYIGNLNENVEWTWYP